MYLKELTINGFKSFAKRGELEFSQPITAIVGPNGSGKSNIAESFRFVLGEQSVKSLRGKKGEDLIWGGSDKVSRGNRAGVVVTFDNADRSFPLDFDEVSIARVVHRDGQNEYLINDTVVRLRDIHELLSHVNIGPTGHHIISQGEADRMLTSGPRERRDIIEDALGLKGFQLKKKEAERKLSKTQENIAQVELLRRESAPHLNFLAKQIQKAERSLELKKRLRNDYAEYLKREDVYLCRRQEQLTASRTEPAWRLNEIGEEIAAAKAAVDQAGVVKDESGAVAEAEAALAAATRSRSEAERAHSHLSGQIAFLERRLSTATQRTVTEEMIPCSKFDQLILEVEEIVQRASSANDLGVVRSILSGLLEQFRRFVQQTKPTMIDTTLADKAELSSLKEQLPRAGLALESALAEEAKEREALELVRAKQVSGLQVGREAEQKLYTLLNEQRELEHTVRTIDLELSHLERDRGDFRQQLQEAVALLGRDATAYYQYEVRDESGNIMADDVIAEENRELQRTRQHDLEKLKIRLEELGSGPTDSLLKEHKDAYERDEFLARELEDLGQSVANLQVLIGDMQAKLQEQFTQGLSQITKEFNTFFTIMFGGGTAALRLVTLDQEVEDGSTPEGGGTEFGVEVEISLPNKRVRGLHMLSGGERTLTSIALIFAMSQVNPPPFIILDETDAALDEANSRRYGDMIEALAKKSQLVLITHNRETMSRAGVLYGVTMGMDGASKLLSVKFEDAAANAAR